MNKFEEAYGLVNGDLGCPKNCKVCENQALQFLPGEVEFLSKKSGIPEHRLATLYKIEGHAVWLIGEREKHCPFHKFGKCISRYARPLDCRAYPVIPCLKKGKISVMLDRKCPLVKQNKIKKEVVRKALEAYRTINPPIWWVRAYELDV